MADKAALCAFMVVLAWPCGEDLTVFGEGGGMAGEERLHGPESFCVDVCVHSRDY